MNKRPASRRPAVGSAPAGPAAPVDLHSACVLVADDDVAAMIEQTLRQAGCNSVTLVSNGVEALDQAETSRFDLILLNYSMPRLNGAVTLRVLRNRGHDTPVIMISSWDRDEIAEPLDGLDLDDFIEKPFTSAFLIRRIGQVLAKHSARRRTERPSPTNRSTQ